MNGQTQFSACPSPIETAAWFLLQQPGGVGRFFARHTALESGSCAGCGTYRPVRWPCVLVYIARRAQQIHPGRAVSSADAATPGMDKPATRVAA